jgi:hypothetical protein
VRDVEWRTGPDVRWYDVQISQLHAADGSPVGMGIAFVDISRYRRPHEHLEHSKERLETELETMNEERAGRRTVGEET